MRAMSKASFTIDEMEGEVLTMALMYPHSPLGIEGEPRLNASKVQVRASKSTEDRISINFDCKMRSPPSILETNDVLVRWDKIVSILMSYSKMMVFSSELQRLESDGRDRLHRVFEEYAKRRSQLDSERRELEKLVVATEMERKKLEREKEKREKEAALIKILDLEKQLDAKQQLELEVEQLKGKLAVMNQMGEEDLPLKMKLEKMTEELEEKSDVNTALLAKERQTNDELQRARKALITGFEEMQGGRTLIGIKRMGELDNKPFQNACRRKFSSIEADIKAAELCTFWQEELKNPDWHPFKVIHIGEDCKQVINEDDEKLQDLKYQFGDEVHKAVTTALNELLEYNASDKYIISELWNFKQGRKATLEEAIQYILKQWKIRKRKR
ncbi:putative factor of DNA methylation 5 [Cocos nucifera]|uniref:Putative factor of DNA methylation 5 n=1 Tax=Cocos nucifera TaxID=13894 RepID=A0A8K0ISF9_COCNU|nr:putative factor of DNA methylation 5 [Cocos nucifera]